jgi:hypothetical protein
MVKDQEQDTPTKPAKQGVREVTPEPNKIGASIPYDFEGRNLTAYGGLDTTVHTLFGQQMDGRKSYNPKNRGKKSYPPLLTFLAETKEYVAGALRSGDRPSGKEIAALDSAYAALPTTVQTVYARAGPRGHPRLLLLGGGAGLCEEELPLRPGGAQDGAVGGPVEGGRLEGLAAHRRRRAVRILLPAGRMGPSLPVSGLAV